MVSTSDQIEWIQPWLHHLLIQHAQAVRREDPLQIRILIYISSPMAAAASGFHATPSQKQASHLSALSTSSATPILRSSSVNVEPMAHIDLGGNHETASVNLFQHKLNPYSLINKEVRLTQGAMYFSVCGPGGLADDVRDAVRSHLKLREKAIEFHEEAFSW